MLSGIPTIAATFVVGTVAAICFVVAAIGPLAPRGRAALAVAGIVVDWAPVAAGWMTVTGAPSRVLLGAHFAFGFVGYLLLAYCLLGWIRNRERPVRVRVAFVGVWGVAYLAGVLMAVDALLA